MGNTESNKCSPLDYEQELANHNLQILEYYNPITYSPFVHHSMEQEQDNFSGGVCALVRVKEGNTNLYRLHDNGVKAGEYGQYWTLTPMDADYSTRQALALDENWNDMTDQATLLIPESFCFIVGKAAGKENGRGLGMDRTAENWRMGKSGRLFGGELQAFIPRNQVKLLAQAKDAEKFSKEARLEKFRQAFEIQRTFYNDYISHKKTLKSQNPNSARYGCPRCGK